MVDCCAWIVNACEIHRYGVTYSPDSDEALVQIYDVNYKLVTKWLTVVPGHIIYNILSYLYMYFHKTC